MVRKVLILAICLFRAFTMSANGTQDSAYMALYHHYYQLFDSDSVAEFYEVSAQLQQRFLEKGNLLSYYKIWQNEIFYDADHGETYKAITKANALLEDMNNSKTKHYELPYMSLGYIFETRGTYRIAIHFYQEALDNIDRTDSTGLAHIYSQLAGINLTRNTEMARQWTAKLEHMISSDSLYYKTLLTLKGGIYFFDGERDNFFRTKREFDAYSARTSALDNNGEHIMKVMECAFLGQYDEAQKLLNDDVQDYDKIRRCDILIRIYEMMGQIDLALEEADRRRDLRDSLHNELLFNNLNELNAAVSVAKISEKSAKDREYRLNIVILLLLVALGLFISRYITRRSYQKKIEKQNKKLEIALNEAKGSERMKDIFIQRIGTDIRTPLNVITGYAQIITNPEFELEKEEREQMMQAITQNTVEITNIVNDLLTISQEESKEQPRDDDSETEHEA